MTLLEGLSAATAALGLLKELRDIDRSVDDAEYKLKIAEISSALADAKIALSDASLEINENDQKIQSLKSELDTARFGDTCPKCRKGRLQLTDTRGQTQMGLMHYGVEIWSFQCDDDDCKFEQRRHHDPHGAIPKAAAGKLK